MEGHATPASTYNQIHEMCISYSKAHDLDPAIPTFVCCYLQLPNPSCLYPPYNFYIGPGRQNLKTHASGSQFSSSESMTWIQTAKSNGKGSVKGTCTSPSSTCFLKALERSLFLIPCCFHGRGRISKWVKQCTLLTYQDQDHPASRTVDSQNMSRAQAVLRNPGKLHPNHLAHGLDVYPNGVVQALISRIQGRTVQRSVNLEMVPRFMKRT